MAKTNNIALHSIASLPENESTLNVKSMQLNTQESIITVWILILKTTMYRYPAPQTKLNSGQVRLRNNVEIFVLVPQLCTRIWVRAMIGLLKTSLPICQSRWKEIQNALLVIRWVHWESRTRISSPRGGDSRMKQTGMLVGNFEFNP